MISIAVSRWHSAGAKSTAQTSISTWKSCSIPAAFAKGLRSRDDRSVAQPSVPVGLFGNARFRHVSIRTVPM
jgi:hypothetical protein